MNHISTVKNNHVVTVFTIDQPLYNINTNSENHIPWPFITITHQDRGLRRLDGSFWKKLGVLPLLDRLDETGKIQLETAGLDEEEGLTGTTGRGGGVAGCFFVKKKCGKERNLGDGESQKII